VAAEGRQIWRQRRTGHRDAADKYCRITYGEVGEALASQPWEPVRCRGIARPFRQCFIPDTFWAKVLRQATRPAGTLF